MAVPRNAFLQPSIEVERLDDHLAEVASQWESTELRPSTALTPLLDVSAHVARLHAEFRPDTCPTCSLFNYCRDQIRRSRDPTSLLVEVGVRPNERPSLPFPVLEGLSAGPRANPRSVAGLRATVGRGLPSPTGQKRIDPVGLPGTVNVVIAKSDAAALGVHGMALQRVSANGTAAWSYLVYDTAVAGDAPGDHEGAG